MIYNPARRRFSVMRITTFFVAGLLLLNACTSKKSGEETQRADTTAPAPARPDAAAAPLSENLRRLLGDEPGLFRGVNLGDRIADVKARERLEQFEADASHVGYTFEYPSLESADILYFHDKAGVVTKIDVDLYLNDNDSQARFTNELTAYFNRRFGPSTRQGAGLVWNDAAARLVMKDVTKGTNFGLKLTFAPATGPVTARAAR